MQSSNVVRKGSFLLRFFLNLKFLKVVIDDESLEHSRCFAEHILSKAVNIG